jgi:HAE1 family hydrophobic/amphiphilic exporter-1
MIYKSSIRIYLLFGVMALVGVIAGFNLPVSLFPNSAKPIVGVSIGYGGLSANDFYKLYGRDFESQLQGISKTGNEVELVKAQYDANSVRYRVNFDWGVEHGVARNEVENVANNLKSRLPQESADSLNVWAWNRNTGFFALSFFSPKRELNELYDIVEPVFGPMLARIEDADNAKIWNPRQMEVKIVLDQQKIAKLGVLPRDVFSAINNNNRSYSGGSIKQGDKSLSLSINNSIKSVEELKNILINIKGKNIYLSQIATIELSPSANFRKIFKTNGSPSLILFASPKGGGNVKKMSEDIINLVKSGMKGLPSDIQYRILVDPSEFIRSAIKNVFHEVVIAAILAVMVLFLFIGDIRNVATSAIEIPLSMVVAFIFMNLFDVNLNLISLGGLALAAGMNVDASVVVLENIFRHLRFAISEKKAQLTTSEKLDTIIMAVKEVALPVFVSMFTTLIVFIPIAFTSKLTNAILGDLAKAVIFSHCFSAFVAVVLVPTIRYQIIKNKKETKIPYAPLDRPFRKFDTIYDTVLNKLFSSKKWVMGLVVSLVSIMMILGFAVLPSLPKEIIGKPDSDWIDVFVQSKTFHNIKQMEEKALEVEHTFLKKYGDKIQYTFVQVMGQNRSVIMFRLKDKKESESMLKKLEEEFQNTPDTFYFSEVWNPASLPLPNPHDMNIVIKGKDTAKNIMAAEKIINTVKENKHYERIWSDPSTGKNENIQITPYKLIWDKIQTAGERILPTDIIDYAMVADGGKKMGEVSFNNTNLDVNLVFGKKGIKSLEELRAIPFNIQGKIIPMSAVANIERVEAEKLIYRENGETIVKINARKDRADKRDHKLINAKVEKDLELLKEQFGKEAISIEMIDPKKELNDSLTQLAIALGISLLLIFAALVMQFGNIINPLVIMMAIPLGLIGVFVSLYVFDSNLSLNSALGMILLNGVAVNNSILIVDFSQKLFSMGRDAKTAVLEASRRRLKPILITSLTTILGMLPIALGMGEGGKILQPLGITVSGGLWFSTFLTILVIPVLQYLYLSRIKVPVTTAEGSSDHIGYTNSEEYVENHP